MEKVVNVGVRNVSPAAVTAARYLAMLAQVKTSNAIRSRHVEETTPVAVSPGAQTGIEKMVADRMALTSVAAKL